jgi:hypothetical protein
VVEAIDDAGRRDGRVAVSSTAMFCANVSAFQGIFQIRSREDRGSHSVFLISIPISSRLFLLRHIGEIKQCFNRFDSDAGIIRLFELCAACVLALFRDRLFRCALLAAA